MSDQQLEVLAPTTEPKANFGPSARTTCRLVFLASGSSTTWWTSAAQDQLRLAKQSLISAQQFRYRVLVLESRPSTTCCTSDLTNRVERNWSSFLQYQNAKDSVRARQTDICQICWRKDCSPSATNEFWFSSHDHPRLAALPTLGKRSGINQGGMEWNGIDLLSYSTIMLRIRDSHHARATMRQCFTYKDSLL
jgi:hypothetical protein